MSVVTRKEWGARKPRATNPNAPRTKNSTLFIHYSVSPGDNFVSFSQQIQAVRNIQNYHMDGNGWDDIGYSYIITQGKGIPPRVFRGRGFKHAQAAQQGWNTTGDGSVCVIADENDEIRPETVELIEWVFARFEGQKAAPHSSVNATSCPGPKLTPLIPSLRHSTKKAKERLP